MGRTTSIHPPEGVYKANRRMRVRESIERRVKPKCVFFFSETVPSTIECRFSIMSGCMLKMMLRDFLSHYFGIALPLSFHSCFILFGEHAIFQEISTKPVLLTQTCPHAELLEGIRLSLHLKKSTLRSPNNSWLEDEGKWLHERVLGTDLFSFLLLRTSMFVPCGNHHVQVCGPPFKIPKAGPEMKVSRFGMLYSVNMSSPPSSFSRPIDMCRSIFGLRPDKRHLRRRFKELMPAMKSMVERCLGYEEEVVHERESYPSAHVAARLWAWLRYVIPNIMYEGDRRNMRIIRQLVYVLVCSSYKIKFIHIMHWSHRWRLNVWTRDMVAKWLFFIVDKWCIPWLKMRYYVTEVSHNLELHYFDKRLWRLKHVLPPATLGLERVHLDSFKNVPRLRLIPKDAHGWNVRPIAAPSDFLVDKLRIAHVILKRILPVGASMFNFRKFLTKIDDEHWEYAIKLDVKQAYDNVNQDELWSFIQDALASEAGPFTVRFYTFNGKVTKIDPLHVPRNTWVSDRCTSFTLSKQELMFVVRRYIFEHFVIYRGKAYRQTKGIWQGSILSPLMCSFYLSRKIGDESIGWGILLRYIDDHVFLGKSLEDVERFRRHVANLVTWNPEKTRIWKKSEGNGWN